MEAVPFGSYELTARLAVGGMAEIFRARRRSDAGFTKNLVIKRVLPHMAEDDDFVRMFIDEAVVAAKLSHPNIVSIIDFGHVDGTYFIAMEYVEGVDLRALGRHAARSGEPIGYNRALQIAISMCRGLGHAHERAEDGVKLGIVHRDVSPHNVLVSLSGDVKVTDFGIAKAMARATRTGTGVIKGKVSYMAPEQARGETIDQRIDVYATGIVLWEMLTGARAFGSENQMVVLRQVQQGELPSLREHAPEAPERLVSLVEKMTARMPDNRFARMREVERELAKVLQELGGVAAAPLDEYLARVLPQATIDALRDEAPPVGTQSLPSKLAPKSATQSIETRAKTALAIESSAPSSAGTAVATDPGSAPLPAPAVEATVILKEAPAATQILRDVAPVSAATTVTVVPSRRMGHRGPVLLVAGAVVLGLIVLTVFGRC